MVKDFKELEEERKEKQFYNEIKKWSFEDYTNYRKNIERKTKTIVVFLLIFYVGTWIAILFAVLYFNSFYTFQETEKALLEIIEARNNILINEAEKRCNEINQTFIHSEVVYYKQVLLVKCSENNLVIGGRF